VFRKRFVLPGRREALESAEQEVLAALQQHGYDHAAVFAIRLALEEALSNALRHGNVGNPARSIVLEFEIDAQQVILHIQDEGEGFDPSSVPDPTAAENLDIPAGRGLMLMRSFMAEVIIHPPGNRVTMRYARGASENAPG
jgi:serine/threonine-protein kinase RsbW